MQQSGMWTNKMENSLKAKIRNLTTWPNLRPQFSQFSLTPWRSLQSQHSTVTTSSLLSNIITLVRNSLVMKHTCVHSVLLDSNFSRDYASPCQSVVLRLIVTEPTAVEPIAAGGLEITAM